MRIPFSFWVGLALAALCALLPAGPSTVRAQTGSPPTGRAYVANSDSGDVSVIDTGTNTVIATVPVEKAPNGLALSPKLRQLYVANFGDDSVSVINTDTNEVVARVPVEKSPASVAVTTTGTFILVPNFNSDTLSVLDTSGGGFARSSLQTRRGPIGVAVRSKDSRVFVTNNGSNAVSSFEIKSGESTTEFVPVDTQRVGARPLGIAVHPNNNRVYVVNSGDNTVSILDESTGKAIGALKVGRSPAGVAIRPVNGTRAYVTNFGDDTVSVIEIPAKQPAGRVMDRVVGQIRVGSGPTGVTVSPDETHVYVTNFNEGTVSVISTASGEETDLVTVGNGPNAIACR